MSDPKLIIELPAPFADAIATGNFAAVTDAPTPSPAAIYARGVARLALGRENEARADFQTAFPDLPDPCQIELAFLEIRQRSDINAALAQARAIADRAPKDSALAARALHVAGLAEGKLRHSGEAVDLLLAASRIYRDLGDINHRAQVFDTLGSIEAARGRVDYAMYFYALSLVDKTLANDRAGIAITLGNIGRVHLRVGRFDDALECFTRDLALAEQMHDQRGIGRMLEDIGRTHLAADRFTEAEQSLNQCVEFATRSGLKDLVIFAHKDLAMLRIAQRRLPEAGKELALAQKLIARDTEPFLQQVLSAAQGELALAQNDPAAVELLKRAVAAFSSANIPDLEIPTRIALARALAQQRFKLMAQDCLLKGMNLARADGYARYLPDLREEMTRLDLIEGVVEEQSRGLDESRISEETPQTDDSQEQGVQNYHVLQKLGGGAFGDVFRVYDPQRAMELALKRFKLASLYDTRKRKAVIASAKVELEAASRVRHPGVVRVLALGFDPSGELYVVQDFIEGQSLRDVLTERMSLRAIYSYLSKIASALAALHDGGVVHRDLKPENVLVNHAGLPVLVDFGIAHIASVDGPSAAMAAGTPSYMAPEQARGGVVDGRADLYALGAMSYEWLTGTVPIRTRGTTLKQIAEELDAARPVPIISHRPDLTKTASDLIMSMLARVPASRPASAAAVAEQFSRLAKSTPEADPGIN